MLVSLATGDDSFAISLVLNEMALGEHGIECGDRLSILKRHCR